MVWLLFLLVILLSAALASDVAPDECRELLENIDSTKLNEKQKQVFHGALMGKGDELKMIGVALFEKTVFGDKNEVVAVKLLKCADYYGNKNASFHIGKAYHQGLGVSASRKLAIYWYQRNLNNYKSHATLYNIGLLHAESDEKLEQFQALQYFQESYNIDYSSVSKTAHEVMCTRVANGPALDIMTQKLLFPHANLIILDQTVMRLWENGIDAMTKFNHSFIIQKGVLNHEMKGHLMTAAESFIQLIEGDRNQLHSLQKLLILENLQDILGTLTAKNESYIPIAAKYIELLASNEYCYNKYAVQEHDAACFNGAVSSAVSLYRRIDEVAAARVFHMGRAHPYAATNWNKITQTPRVFHKHLDSSPYWDTSKWIIAKKLSELYASHSTALQVELDNMISLNEGNLRFGGSVLSAQGGDDGLNRIFTPYIAVRNDNQSHEVSGAGSWAEFGPLFDGLRWNDVKCDVLSSLCNTLKQIYSSEKEICTSHLVRGVDASINGVGTLTPVDVEQACGSDTIVTVLRLRPGTHITPHCGTTNKRLILHFCLRGCNGVDFRVEENWISSYGNGDGSTIIFDDSYEHEVKHRGDNDRFVALVVLNHPTIVV